LHELIVSANFGPNVLGAKPAALITSYHTGDFVEEDKNGCPIGQLYIQMKHYLRLSMRDLSCHNGNLFHPS